MGNCGLTDSLNGSNDKKVLDGIKIINNFVIACYSML